MLAARRLQNGCPSCTAQILKLYVNSIADIAPAAAAAAAAGRRTTRTIATTSTRHHSRRSHGRFLSTSARKLQDGNVDTTKNNEPSNALPNELTQQPKEEQPLEEEEDQEKGEHEQELAPAEVDEELEAFLDQFEQDPELPETQDAEAMVRQAKRIFGDTLPRGYLSDEEYKLYERLYGAPLRETAPEDVGFGSLGDAEQEESKSAAAASEYARQQQQQQQHSLLREDQHGNLEEVEYTIEKDPVDSSEPGTAETGQDGVAEAQETYQDDFLPVSETQLEYIEANVSNQREYEAMLRLQQDFEAARQRAAKENAAAAAAEAEAALDKEQDVEEEQEDEDDEDDDDMEEYKDEATTSKQPDARFAFYPGQEGPRSHPYSVEGRFGTSPRTIFLPRDDFVRPITRLLKRTDHKHVQLAAEKHFGGAGLPNSPATPEFGKSLPQKGLGLEASDSRLSEIEADAFMSAALPGIFASVSSTLVEVRKRLGPDWLKGLLSRTDKDGVVAGPRVLDYGAGGAGLSAWQSVLQAEWDLMREKDATLAAEPPGKKTVIVGSDTLRHRISRFLQNTQFLPRLPQYAAISHNKSSQHLDAPEVPQKRKVYDVIIATHVLVPLEREWRRKDVLDNLWSMLSPDGGVLIVLEKGHPRGFEAVADVRQRLLDEFIISPKHEEGEQEEEVTTPEAELPREREPGMIVAPCTNHKKCPMYLTPGFSPGRKDFCHFTQRFTRPPFLQTLLNAKRHNYEDINFSYIAVRRGMPPSTSTSTSTTTKDPIAILQGKAATEAAFAGYESTPTDSPARPHPLSLPRSILPPLKRKGHVTLDVCTPAGAIERWTVPKSFSKQAYHDARKSRWGDLWALGAKTRVARKVRLGRGGAATAPQDGGVRAARAATLNGIDWKGRRVKKGLKVVELGVNQHGVLVERVKGLQPKRPERRTKGGRKPPREMNLLRLDDGPKKQKYRDEEDD